MNRAVKREHILISALRVFARKGYRRATVKDVAREAGIGKSTIYEYFKSKNHLFKELVDFLFKDLERRAFSSLDPEAPPPEQLCALVKAFADYMSNMPYGSKGETLAITLDIFSESVRSGIVDLRPVYYRELLGLKSIIQRGVELKFFRDDIDPAHIVSVIIAFMDGILTQWLLLPERVDINERSEEFCKILIDGLKPTTNS